LGTEKTMVKGISKSGEVTGDIEEASSLLDGIPGADVVGALAGIGATLYGAFHHIKSPAPADNFHISPQTGVE